MGAILQLPDVTLIAVTAVNIDETHFALQHCLQAVEFGAVKLLCPELPSTPDPRVKYQRIPPIKLDGYNRILLRLLHTQFDTRHCLIVQADGYILNPERWRQEFLEYDYIGAPWPAEIEVGNQQSQWTMTLTNRVGNGGFSLRSKKLMEAVAQVPVEAMSFPVMSEDIVICHYLHDQLVARGLKFAPLELAARFAVETEAVVPGQSLETAFGFHGKHLLEKVAPIVFKSRPCPCGSGNRYADCHGRG